MTCSYEEALQIEEDFLIFAKEVKEKNSSKWSNNEKVIKIKVAAYVRSASENFHIYVLHLIFRRRLILWKTCV